MSTAGVVVAWRQVDITIRALRSLAAMEPSVDQLVCVAQQFTPAELRRVSEACPGRSLTVIDLTENLGFGAAANVGMARAIEDGAGWLLLVNNDATVTVDCLRRCREEAAGRPRLAIVGPAITFSDPPGTLWYAGGRHSHHFAFTRHPGLCRPAATAPPTGDTDYVSGCCALISTTAWLEVGPFREDFFLYYEDAEWCARARDAGWYCRYLGEVLCIHEGSASSGLEGGLGVNESTAYYHARNPLRYALDTRAFWLRWSRVVGLTVVWNGYNAWRVIKSRRLSVARSYLQGLNDAWHGRVGPRPVHTSS